MQEINFCHVVRILIGNKIMKKLITSLTICCGIFVAACNSGSGSSTSPSQAQQFANLVGNQLALIKSNQLVPYQIAFTQESNQAFIIAATSQSASQNPRGTIYINPILYVYNGVGASWTSASLKFPVESSFISNIAVFGNNLYLATESYYDTPNEFSLNYSNLYQYNGSNLNVVNNPFNSECHNSCSITSMVVSTNTLYVSGWNDSGTQIYSYNGESWNNILDQPANQLSITSLAVDKSGNLIASGYNGTIESTAATPFLSQYSNGNWTPLPYANGGAIVAANSNLYSMPLAAVTGINTYGINKLISSGWSQVATYSFPSSDCALVPTGLSLVSDTYGNLYSNMNATCAMGGYYPLTSLIYPNY